MASNKGAVLYEVPRSTAGHVSSFLYKETTIAIVTRGTVMVQHSKKIRALKNPIKKMLSEF